MKLDDSEGAAMVHLQSFMDEVRAWGLNCNQDEYIHAVHTLQHFVIMHAIKRLDPDSDWSSWYASTDKPNS